MKTKSLKYILSVNDWIDIRITKDMSKDQIIKFSINLTSIISGNAYSVIRYDNAHGFTHIDRFWESTKEIIEDKSKEEIINLANMDIARNWKKYRRKLEIIIGGKYNDQ